MIPISKPYITGIECDFVCEVLNSGWVTQGPKVKAFEEKICEYTGAKYCVAVNNCTSALYMVMHALEYSYNDVVLCPSTSFIATANSIKFTGATPLFVDTDSKTLNLSIEKIHETIDLNFIPGKNGNWVLKNDQNKKLKGVMAVHQIGNPLDIESLLKISKKYNIEIIEDAACALGSQYFMNDRLYTVGNSPFIAACFSLHPRKVITSGEGGFITTNNVELYHKLKALRHHGMSVSDTSRHNSKDFQQEAYNTIGFNFRLSDINAAVALAQLEKIEDILKKYRLNWNLYYKLLSSHPQISFLNGDQFGKCNYQSIIIKIDTDVIQLINKLRQSQIHSKKGIMAIHNEVPYSDTTHILPEAEKLYDKCLTLPNFYDLTDNEIEFVCSKILDFLNCN